MSQESIHRCKHFTVFPAASPCPLDNSSNAAGDGRPSERCCSLFLHLAFAFLVIIQVSQFGFFLHPFWQEVSSAFGGCPNQLGGSDDGLTFLGATLKCCPVCGESEVLLVATCRNNPFHSTVCPATILLENRLPIFCVDIRVQLTSVNSRLVLNLHCTTCDLNHVSYVGWPTLSRGYVWLCGPPGWPFLVCHCHWAVAYVGACEYITRVSRFAGMCSSSFQVAHHPLTLTLSPRQSSSGQFLAACFSFVMTVLNDGSDGAPPARQASPMLGCPTR